MPKYSANECAHKTQSIRKNNLNFKCVYWTVFFSLLFFFVKFILQNRMRDKVRSFLRSLRYTLSDLKFSRGASIGNLSSMFFASEKRSLLTVAVTTSLSTTSGAMCLHAICNKHQWSNAKIIEEYEVENDEKKEFSIYVCSYFFLLFSKTETNIRSFRRSRVATVETVESKPLILRDRDFFTGVETNRK